MDAHDVVDGRGNELRKLMLDDWGERAGRGCDDPRASDRSLAGSMCSSSSIHQVTNRLPSERTSDHSMDPESERATERVGMPRSRS